MSSSSSVTFFPQGVRGSCGYSNPCKEEGKYSLVELVLSYIKEKPKDIVKWFGYSAFWVGQAVPELLPKVQPFSLSMGDMKNFLSSIEIPEKAYTSWQSLNGLWMDLTKKASGDINVTWTKVGNTARKTFKDCAGFTNNICDGIDFSSKYFQYSQETLRWMKGVNFTATLTGAGISAAEQIYNISQMQDSDPKRTTFYLINLARDVSYVAVSIIGLSFISTGAPAWMTLACLTSGLTLSMGSFFYERIVDPENKGKHLNPAYVVEKALAQRDLAVTA